MLKSLICVNIILFHFTALAHYETLPKLDSMQQIEVEGAFKQLMSVNTQSMYLDSTVKYIVGVLKKRAISDFEKEVVNCLGRIF